MTASARADPAGAVAVVGAGVAGAGVAAALADAAIGADVTVFERADDPGGRTATRRRDGCVYDTGANYAKDGSRRVSDLVRSLDEGDLVDVEAPVWTFDADGSVSPGGEDRDDDHKWTYEGGIATLPRRLLERSGATVRTGVEVTGLERVAAADANDGADRWWLDVDGGGDGDSDGGANGRSDRAGPFDAVVLTPPGPATAAILETSDADVDADLDLRSLARASRAVSYRSIHSFALHYPFALERPYYALVNADREHAVGWVAREGEKRGHVPDGETLLIAQMAPDWSEDRRSTGAEDASREAAEEVASLLEDDRLTDPDWVDRIRWRDALPDDDWERPTRATRAAESAGLFLASDCTHGRGRAHASLECGLETGDRVRERLEGTRDA